jgi:hypothetical protein
VSEDERREAMNRAFKQACARLGLTGATPVIELVAIRILELVRDGEFDPDRLTEATVATFRRVAASEQRPPSHHTDAHLSDDHRAPAPDDLAQRADPVDLPALRRRLPRDTRTVLGNDSVADHPQAAYL